MKEVSGLSRFIPDLIVEATGLCNRKCSGCYAPNLVTLEDPVQLFKASPELFLDPKKLADALKKISLWKGTSSFKQISVRGGEPSLHPKLAKLFEVIYSHSKNIFLETHGRWLLESDQVPRPTLGLLEACRAFGVTLKISFDSMHRLSGNALESMLSRADQAQILWKVAITEEKRDFERTLKECAWISNEKIILQEKVHDAEGLIQPVFGVIHTDGSISSQLKHKFQESPPQRMEASR